MDKTELLYDHYKETNAIMRSVQADRNKYFCFLCVTELVSFLFMLRPSDMISTFSSWINGQYSVTIPVTVSVIQVALWLMITYFLIVYVQRNMSVERQYAYLTKIEHDISDSLGVSCFDREGDTYLKDYPAVLNVIDFFYKWIIPLGFCSLHAIRIINEMIYHGNVWVLCIDVIICIFSLVVMISYFIRIAIKK